MTNKTHKSRRKSPKGGHSRRSKPEERSFPAAPRLEIDARIPPGERDVMHKAKQETDRAIQDWLDAAATQARKKRPPKAHITLRETLDDWQREALDALLQGEHVIVDAPTTAGKTRVVEAYFEMNIQAPHFRAAYTTPVKSLSNDKLQEFSEQFGKENVGIATGDIKENLSAPIVVATLESYRNSLLGVEPDLGRSLVVFDEYHFMQDIGRGSAWEEAIILTPPTCQLLLLSASVENAEQFCAWIQQISGRTCRLVQTRERPVPLVDLIYYREQWLLYDTVKNLIPAKPATPPRFPLEHDEIARRLGGILKMGLSPCIVYTGRRLSCENLALEICKHLEPIPIEEAQAIRAVIESKAEIADLSKFLKPNLRKMMLVYGVGYHHSGLAPYARRAIENLVKNGQLRFCVATMGLSIGINFSVRSTLISDYVRPGEYGFTAYTPSEVLQMLGRAGRRGKDLVGFSLWPSTASFQKLGGATRESCESRLKNDPTTFLGLLGRGFKLRDIENFYEKSFLRFGNRSVQFALIRDTVLKKLLNVTELPCGASPAGAFSRFSALDTSSPCWSCPHKGDCHPQIRKKMSNSLAQLHGHLHKMGAIDDTEHLTEFGAIARYFPQSGGLLVAQLIANGTIHLDNLLAGTELMASLCLSRFKEPRPQETFEFPFDPEGIEAALTKFYPLELFLELYDPPGPRRDTYVFREFNPLGASPVNDWVKGMSWVELVRKTTDEKFGQGDLMALLYRVATYLQSLSAAKIPGLSPAAANLRDIILRAPLTPQSPADEEAELENGSLVIQPNSDS